MLRALSLACLVAASVAAQTPEGAAASAQGRFIRALTALALEDDSAAVRATDRILEGAPDDPVVLTLRADIARRLGDATDAVFYAERATDAAPDDLQAHLTLAAAYRGAGRLRDAGHALEDARSLAPDDLDVLVATVELAAEQRDATGERRALLDLVRVGDTVGARLRLSALAQAADDLEDARAQALAAQRLAPSEPAVARRLADLDATSRPTASSDETIDDLIERVDANPRQVEAWARLLQALAQAGDGRAASTADDALFLFGSVPSVLVGAAEAFASAGRTADALDASGRALEAITLLGDALEDADALRARLEALAL